MNARLAAHPTSARFKRVIRTGFALGVLAISGCAITTTYGRAPRQSPVDPDVYNFTVYFNQFSSQEDIDKKAVEEFDSFAAANRFATWRVVERSCQNLFQAKCDYQTRFFRSELDAARYESESAPAAPETDERSSPTYSGGTSFLVDSRGTVVTNAHVVEECVRITVAGQEARLLRVDRVNDLAVLSTALTGPHLKVRSGAAQPGESVMAVGYPLQGLLASSPHVTYGTVTATAGLQDDSRYMQVSAPIQPGNSGGPLLDEAGRLVGVVTSKLNVLAALALTADIPQNVNFAVKADLLSVFLNSAGVQFEQAVTGEALSNVALAKVGMGATHPVVCFGG